MAANGQDSMTYTRFLAGLLFLLGMGMAAVVSAQEYRLGDGDNIRIVVFQNPELTLETRVSEDGSITYPLVGTIKIGGLTISAAAKTLSDALKNGGYIQQPQVNIFLMRNLGNQVAVLGQVGKPGRFPLETFNTRLSEMMAMAGGISPAGADFITIYGTRDGKQFRKDIDFTGMFLEDKRDEDLVVAAGDVIYVPKQPMFYIYGEVQRPGTYRVERNMTVRQALVIGGGLSQRGTERNFEVFRRGSDGKVARLGVKLDDPVTPDDVYHVRESLF